MIPFKKYIVLFLIVSLNTSALFAQDEEEAPILSIHRFNIGVSINTGKFSLEGNENGVELMAADLNRNENSTNASTVGVGIDFNYRIVKQLDLIYDYTLEYAVEAVVDHYWIKSHNIGAKYRPVSLGGFSPFVKLSYSSYRFGELSVYDPVGMSWSHGSNIGQYNWRGKGLTTGIGMEIKSKKTAYYSLSYNRLMTIGNIVADEGAVVFENKPKHHYFSFGFRVGF